MSAYLRLEGKLTLFSTINMCMVVLLLAAVDVASF